MMNSFARLKLRAAEHGRSAEAEHRQIPREGLAMESRRSFKELAAKVHSMTARRPHTPSERLLREGATNGDVAIRATAGYRRRCCGRVVPGPSRFSSGDRCRIGPSRL